MLNGYQKQTEESWPIYGWVGIGLVIIFWYLNWSLSGLRTHWGFFPLWLGYCLLVDAIVRRRRGTSLISRNFPAFVGLFLVSAPAWWLFELFNLLTQNWIYEGRQFFSSFQYFALASLSFSTVMPAVFETAELVSTFEWIKNIKRWPIISPKRRTPFVLFSVGLTMLIFVINWPQLFFPLVWISVYLLIEPINIVLGNRSLIKHMGKTNWRPILSLAIGCLICGFFWEMWNFYSYPKWIYQIPVFDFIRIFEMPILGYLGYLFFALELFALYHLIIGLLKLDPLNNFVQLTVEVNFNGKN